MSFADTCAVAVDWSGAFESYQWNGGWREGLGARRSLAASLTGARELADKSAAVDAITRWGHVPPLRGETLRKTLLSVDRLASIGDVDPRGATIYAQRIASVSKVYEMSDLNRWIIYDSRVAWALEWMRNQVPSTEAALIPPFPQPPARAAQPYPDSPSVRTESQGRDAFLRASLLARQISNTVRQPCPDPNGWTAAHIEMALFTIGGKTNRQEDWMARTTSGRGKTTITPARAASNVVTQVLPTDVVRQQAEQYVLTWIQQFRAKQHATNYAYQTDSQAAHVQFPDGGQRWVVFHDGDPIAAFPGYDDDIDEALRFHNYERLKMQSPKELEQELESERESRKSRWKIWARDASAAEQEEVADLLQLEPGEL